MTTEMTLVGYTDRLSVRAGETLTLHGSSRAGRFEACVVRLIHGDDNPAGPGFKATKVADIGPLEADWHDIPQGSYFEVMDLGTVCEGDFTFSAWVQPTLRTDRTQTIASHAASAAGCNWCVLIGTDGRLTAEHEATVVQLATPLETGLWYFVVLSIADGRMMLRSEPRNAWPGLAVEQASAEIAMGRIVTAPASFRLAAQPCKGQTGTANHFNGRIARPALWAGGLNTEQVRQCREGSLSSPVAGWDFSADQSALVLHDVSGSGRDGALKRMPTRAVTGPYWDGSSDDFRTDAAAYDAIHFHDDDREDAEWPATVTIKTQADWTSGIYAFQLTDGEDAEDYVPFFVRPAEGAETQAVAFLAPTFSYMAYANEQIATRLAKEPAVIALFGGKPPYPTQAQDRYVVSQNLLSTYDLHSDGSGVMFTSHRMPIVNMRPKVNFQLLNNLQGSPHQFNADLHLIDWLDHMGQAHDVIADHDLHADGLEALAPYKVILTGTHPEYWSGRMLDALIAYLNNGGRLMYLGGNGFYWVTTQHPAAPHVIELRKWSGNRAWQPGPGEFRHQSTGELGGLWRERGKAPNTIVGVGFGSEGFDCNAPYRRTKASHDERMAFVFDGVDGETFGDVPSLVMSHGAAGFEMDRYEAALGSPPHTTVLASSFGHSKSYLIGVEDIQATHASLDGETNENVRADLAWLEYPNGGSVFSVSSISWCGCLSTNGYDNDIARITGNVLRQMLGSPSGMPVVGMPSGGFGR